MNLTELKKKPIQELVEMAEKIGVENVGRLRKQDIIFTILKITHPTVRIYRAEVS
ncbi:MAG: hypothetical protein Ct9H90mP18_00070 [Gammaproteobacteria bacterium]|nr:MAG: hypothetical protein Ct9H90mP18_00070 [Gammaproteobacteria bacterium]